MAKHARLSASGSKRWINCPGSVAAEADKPDRGSSFFAMQGTAGHALADLCLTDGTNAEDYLGAAIYVHDEFDTVIVPNKDKGYFAKWEKRGENEGYTKFVVADDSQQVEPWAVQMFVDKVHLEMDRNDADLFGIKLVTEKYLDMTWLHPLFGGTADANFLGKDEWIKLFDYKHGAGVIVEVEDNTQLIKYAVGIMKEYPNAKGVDMWIVQPRAAHADGPIRHQRYTRKELEKWAKYLVAAADLTQLPDAPRKAGDWCLFCKAANPIDCTTFKEHTQNVARMQFDDPPEIIEAPTDNEELARLAEWIPMLDALAKQVDGAIARELHHGRKVRGWKLVRGKTNRKFGRPADDEAMGYTAGDEVPEEEIVKLMTTKGKLKKAQLYTEPKLITLAQMEKLSKEAKKEIKAITFKPEGALTVARADDPREAVEVERTEFDDAPDLLEGMT